MEDDKRLSNFFKIERNPRFEYSSVNPSEIFLNLFFSFLQIYGYKFRIFMKAF